MNHKYLLQPLTKAAQLYTFHQSHQLSMQSGLIGHLCATIGTVENDFHYTWTTYNQRLYSKEFITELSSVIESFKEKGCFLHSIDTLTDYLNKTAHTASNGASDYFGTRIDTTDYTYLFRMCPSQKESTLYCYCYKKDRLISQLEHAESGIRFINSRYTELFRIPDGGRIRIKNKDGSSHDYACRYIDQYHLEVGHDLFHICEFAERMETNGCLVEPLD